MSYWVFNKNKDFKNKSTSLCGVVKFNLELKAATSGQVSELSILFSQH